MKKSLKKVAACLLALALCFGIASAEKAAFLEKPFPDFTATDTEGNTFALSEALADHEAVLINFWASWCGPCRLEFPYLQKAWEAYGDRVAFIALSAEPEDTMEMVAAIREEFGITFPMGLDEGRELFDYTGAQAYPSTVIVDRFGNAAFFHSGMFLNPQEVERVLDAFLGEDYTQTAALEEIPLDSSTRAFPLSAKRAIHVDNEHVKRIHMYVDGVEAPVVCYLIPDENTAHIRLEISAADNPVNIIYEDYQGPYLLVTDLLDPGRGAYVYDQSIEGENNGEEYHFNSGYLSDLSRYETDPEWIRIFLIRDEAAIAEIEALLAMSGYEGFRWEYADPEPAEESAPQAYIIHAVDQYGDPVPGVYVNFCTDTACALAAADENGLIAFDGAPDDYHVQLLSVPEGYRFDEDFELYTGRAYGEWYLRVRKD